MVNKDLVRAKRDHYLKCAKENLDAAQNYLHKYAGEWSREHEENYTSFVNGSAMILSKVEVLDDILEGVYD